MNETLRLIHQRRSVRAYEEHPVAKDTVDTIIRAAMRAPTAGNLMLYSILEIDDPELKKQLARSCDNQPFIARSPLVLVFLADYQRWIDAFVVSGVPAYCEGKGEAMRLPGEGDLLLACCDALIAAQTAVIAAEALGLGSCYIGDIMEHYEHHKKLLDLPRYAFPITMVCFGYPTEAARERDLTSRFPQDTIRFKGRYRRLDDAELLEMLETRRRGRAMQDGVDVAQRTYLRKFSADFTVEMTRSVREAIRSWTSDQPRETKDRAPG